MIPISALSPQFTSLSWVIIKVPYSLSSSKLLFYAQFIVSNAYCYEANYKRLQWQCMLHPQASQSLKMARNCENFPWIGYSSLTAMARKIFPKFIEVSNGEHDTKCEKEILLKLYILPTTWIKEWCQALDH